MKKISAIVFISLFFGQFADGQDAAEKIRKQFEAWQNAFPQVMVQAIFNQNKYAPGDTAFFKVYFVTEQWTKVAGRQVLHLSLVNSAGHEVSVSNFGVKDGIGFNQFILPDTLSSGYYQFTMYNDWMRNFSPSFFFHKEILVAGKNRIEKIEKSKPTSIEFFPEGGTLVEGVSNKVIIRVNGISQQAGDLITQDENVVTPFTIDSSGLGLVVFNPLPGTKYAIRLNGQKYDLPAAQSNGISVLVTPQYGRKPIKILLSTHLTSTLRREELVLLLAMHGKIYFSATTRFDDKEYLQVMIPQEDLPEGIAELAVLTASGKKIATRLFPVVENKKVEVVVNVASPRVSARQEINVEVAIADEHGNPLSGEFSISAVNERFFKEDSIADFNQSLILLNDLKAIDPSVENIQIELSSLDKWLITQTWRRYDWNKILSRTLSVPSYQMDTYLGKRGRAYYPSTGLPAPDSTLITVYLRKRGIAYESHTRANGEFDIYFFDFWGEDDLFYMAERKGEEKNDLRVEFLEDQVLRYPSHVARQKVEEDEYGAFSRKKRAVDYSYNFYFTPPKPKLDPDDPNAEMEDEFSGADFTINVQDYILFPTMVEMLKEIIPAARSRVHGNKRIVRVELSDDYIFATGDPLYIIDGIITKNTEFFLNLVPADLLTIKVVNDVNKLRALGTMSKNGVILVQTKKIDPVKLRAASTTMPIIGLTKAIDFKIRNPEKMPARFPEFKSTLYWAPTVHIPASGKTNFSFFASDDTGAILIRIAGITNSGRPFSAYRKVSVEFNPNK